MLLTNENIGGHIDLFLQQYFPDAKMVILCGSAASQSMAEGSDIDLAIFQDGLSHPVYDGFRHQGIPFDIVVYPCSGMDEYLYDHSRKSHLGKILCYLSNGVVIRDQIGLADDIIRVAGHYYDRGYRSSSVEVFQLQHLIRKSIAKWKKESDFCRRMLFAASIIDLAIDTVILLNSGWVAAGNMKLKLFKKYDPDLFAFLANYYRAPEVNEATLIRLVEERLVLATNVLSDRPAGYSEEIANVADHLIVAVTCNRSLYELLLLLAASPLPAIAGPLQPAIAGAYYTALIEGNVVLTFPGVSESSTARILETLQAIGLTDDPGLLFRYQTLSYSIPFFLYGGPRGFAHTEQIFSSFTVLLTQLLQDKGEEWVRSFAFTGHLVLAMLFGISMPAAAFDEFVLFIYDKLLVEAYCSNFNIKVSQVRIQREMMEANFKKIFEKNREAYRDLFGSLLEEWNQVDILEDVLADWVRHIREIYASPDLSAISFFDERIVMNSPFRHKSVQWLLYQRHIEYMFSILGCKKEDSAFLFYIFSRLLQPVAHPSL